ncbi:MAG: Maf family protein [Planctomycetota bacterium]
MQARGADIKRESPPAGPDQRRLVLASRSPRRRALLAEHGFAHELALSEVDDGVLTRGSVDAASWVVALAWLKACAGLRSFGGDAARAIVLGSDTLCVTRRDGRETLLGQPANAAAARATLDTLNDSSHEVLTGVALMDAETGERRLFVDRAVVSWGRVSDDELDAYVRSEQWRGKAGGYNLSERLEAGWPIRFEGDPASIMGLPMVRLTPMLVELGVARGAPSAA